jgi:hypothetical protein
MSGMGGAAVSAYGLLEGQSQREAARFFFEMLLLNNKGYVKLHQVRQSPIHCVLFYSGCQNSTGKIYYSKNKKETPKRATTAWDQFLPAHL